MKLNKEEFIEQVINDIDCNWNDFSTDIQGQVILHTGIYRWNDGCYYNVRERYESIIEEYSSMLPLTKR